MTEPIRSKCPHCESVLRFRKRSLIGTRVSCPKCDESFVVKALRPRNEADARAQRQLPKRRSTRAARPIDKKTRHPATEEEPLEATLTPFTVISGLIWINASVATVVCLIDCLIDLVFMVSHFDDMRQQLGVGRLVARQLSRPVLVAIAAGGVWWHSVWPRDINMRRTAIVFGAGFVLLFGVVGYITVALGNAAFEDAIFSLQWSAIYLGVSLLLFAGWGYGPESRTEYAERLMANGRFYDALEVVQRELADTPDNLAAVRLEKTLRDIMKSR